MRSLFLSFLALTTSTVEATNRLNAKMIGSSNPRGQRRLKDESPTGLEEGKTYSAIFIRTCTPDEPIVFPLSGGAGHGSITVVDGDVDEITLTNEDDVGLVELYPGLSQEGAFASLYDGDQVDEGTIAIPFMFEGIPMEGGAAVLACDEDVSVMITFKDEFGPVEYLVETTDGSPGHASTTVEITNAVASVPLYVDAMVKGGFVNNGRRHRRTSEAVVTTDSTDHSITFETYGSYDDTILLQMEIITEDELQVYRTIILEDKPAPPKPTEMKLQSAAIDDNDDLVLQFDGVEGHALIKAVIDVEHNGRFLDDEITIEAMSDDGVVIMHSGWARKVFHDNGVEPESNDHWTIYVADAVAEDPNNGYFMIASLTAPEEVRLDLKKEVLSAKPSLGESSITPEMLEGRNPLRPSTSIGFDPAEVIQIDPEEGIKDIDDSTFVGKQGEGRNLQYVTGSYRGARLLVHGYCAGRNPFPTSQFSYDLEFRHSDDNNWSNDLFARRIRDFANGRGLTGCGIVAHSQGGLASLHLWTYYFSCLDNARYGFVSSPRLIQSVGSPYRGTNLAGSLAAIGDVFGAGCGSQNDLTESGADSWLSRIPSSRRSAVWYHRTADATGSTNPFSWCELATDPILGDPEDGVVEVSRGELSGGNSRGVKYGWCHSSGMSRTAQYLDSSRNSELNQYASL